MMINEKGIFVIECKNYAGNIYGKEDYKMWTQYLGGSKKSFYNPIKQNIGHINALKELLPDEDKEQISSFIAFSERATLKVEYEPKRLMVDTSTNCVWGLKKFLKKLPIVFTNEHIDELYNLLYPLTQVSEEEKQEHVDSIKKNKKTYTRRYYKKKSNE